MPCPMTLEELLEMPSNRSEDRIVRDIHHVKWRMSKGLAHACGKSDLRSELVPRGADEWEWATSHLVVEPKE